MTASTSSGNPIEGADEVVDFQQSWLENRGAATALVAFIVGDCDRSLPLVIHPISREAENQAVGIGGFKVHGSTVLEVSADRFPSCRPGLPSQP